MSIYADDIHEFVDTGETESDTPPLGERLRGLADDLSVDSVAEVREIREDV